MSVPIPDPLLPSDRLRVTPWPDPVIDALGHDPRSSYVEQFWLSVLGPSTTWLLRRLAAGLDAEPEGFDLALSETARSLGLGDKNGRHSPFVRSLTRCCQFGLAQVCGGDGLAVRRKLPPLNRHQVSRLPATLQDAHRRWLEADLRTPSATQRLRRARRLALSLVELGEDPEAAERQLHRWKFHPAMAHEAVRWALDRHRQADAAAAGHESLAGSRKDLRSCETDDLGGDAA
jgi:hypothetical protein